MEKKRKLFSKSQVAMEYIMILSLVLLILIPTIYVFREYVSKSSDDVVINNINSVAKNLIDNSREIFYLGSSSKTVIDLEMPKQVEAMWLMDNSNDKNNPPEHLLMFKLNLQDGMQDLYFDSDIPIKCSDCTACNDCAQTINEQCGQKQFNCFVYPETAYSSGLKHFKIEATDCQGALCVFIDEISTIGK